MSDEVLVEGPGLSQIERVVDTFLAPMKTFTDVLRDASWWLPFVIGAVVTYVLAFGIVSKIGWSQVVDNTIQASPATQAKLASMTPAQVTLNHTIMEASFKWSFYFSPALNLLFLLLIVLILWMSINFGFGAKSDFKRVFSMATYAYLPAAIKALVAAIVVWAGAAPENFTMDSMLATNPGYFVSSPIALKTFLSSLDIFTIWIVVLLSIGLATVAKTKRSHGFIVVGGWWLLIVLVSTVFKAIVG